MSEPVLPDPPDVSSLNPQMMTAAELQSRLEHLFEWLQQVEAQPEDALRQQLSEDTVQRVRDAANVLLSEQRDRHSDEHAPRGG